MRSAHRLFCGKICRRSDKSSKRKGFNKKLVNKPNGRNRRGRNLISLSDEKVTEITCHAKGAFERIGSALTLIDIGGQDSKAIAIASTGKVNKFIMNERCAAGTGRFLEVMARAGNTDSSKYVCDGS